MKRAYKYRVYPTKKQARVLHEHLALCAELYNAALQERRDAYWKCDKSITYTQRAEPLPEIKALRPEYEAIYSQVLQDVLRREPDLPTIGLRYRCRTQDLRLPLYRGAD